MTGNYEDILTRIKEEPTWWDQNGCPRYGKFRPEMAPDIYARWVVLLRISCQNCARQWVVEMHGGWPFSQWALPSKLHYGDPPFHEEDPAGSTMNCNDLEVVRVWVKSGSKWVRRMKMEGPIDRK